MREWRHFGDDVVDADDAAADAANDVGDDDDDDGDGDVDVDDGDDDDNDNDLNT